MSEKMLFSSLGGYMLTKHRSYNLFHIIFPPTEAIICFILFSHQLYNRSYGSYMI